VSRQGVGLRHHPATRRDCQWRLCRRHQQWLGGREASLDKRFRCIAAGSGEVARQLQALARTRSGDVDGSPEYLGCPAEKAERLNHVETVFLGATTVLVTDHVTSILVDGFFSRPPLRKLLTSAAPNQVVIEATLARLAHPHLDAVLVSHSHLDHALDAAAVSTRSGAVLVGSESTRMIARGQHYDESMFVDLEPDVPLAFGRFKVTPVRAHHGDDDVYPGRISEPLPMPAPMRRFRSGGCFSFHIAHPHGQVIVQATTGVTPGAWTTYPADLIYLGIGGIGRKNAEWMSEYWRQSVVNTGASTVLPVHWDALWRPLTKPMKPIPRLLDNTAATIRTLSSYGAQDHVTVRLPAPWMPERVR
jgi:L-ascorbate metabolism protein UlaG (beta-lactamase superfamily)